jgi:carboxypeptidase Taq
VALDIGFSLETGRLDVSVHPFTGGTHPTDVRMTTRFKPHDVTEGLTGERGGLAGCGVGG